MCASQSQEPRLVALRKKDGILGIYFEDDGKRIYVTSLVPGGAAALSGKVHKGDVLLRVNDEDMKSDWSEAHAAIKAAPDDEDVELLLQYQPHEYLRSEEKWELRNWNLCDPSKPEKKAASALGWKLAVVALFIAFGVASVGVKARFDEMQRQIDQQKPPTILHSSSKFGPTAKQFSISTVRAAFSAHGGDLAAVATHIQREFDDKYARDKPHVCIVGTDFGLASLPKSAYHIKLVLDGKTVDLFNFK